MPTRKRLLERLGFVDNKQSGTWKAHASVRVGGSSVASGRLKGSDDVLSGGDLGITPFPKLWADYLSKLMSRDGVTDIVDLGSGSGGPVGRVVKELEREGSRRASPLPICTRMRRGWSSSRTARVRYGTGRN
jgi:hypothetical protein